jgi:hypothetical protein
MRINPFNLNHDPYEVYRLVKYQTLPETEWCADALPAKTKQVSDKIPLKKASLGLCCLTVMPSHRI